MSRLWTYAVVVTAAGAIGIGGSAMTARGASARLLNERAERDLVGGACNYHKEESFACSAIGPNGNCPGVSTLPGICGNAAGSITVCASLTTQPNNRCVAIEEGDPDTDCVRNSTNNSCGTVSYGPRAPGKNCGPNDCTGAAQGCGATLYNTTEATCDPTY